MKQDLSLKFSAWKGFIPRLEWMSPSPKQILGPEKLLVQWNIMGPNKFWVHKKFWVYKTFGSKKLWIQNNFGAQEVLGLKFLTQIWGPEKIFGLNFSLHEQIF